VDEKIISGYCRQLDQSRMVTVELESGTVICADCSYGNCPYESGCPIAREIDALRA